MASCMYVAGTIGANMTASPPSKCAGGIRNETKCALGNIAYVLEAAGTNFGNLIDCTVFLEATSLPPPRRRPGWP